MDRWRPLGVAEDSSGGLWSAIDISSAFDFEFQILKVTDMGCTSHRWANNDEGRQTRAKLDKMVGDGKTGQG